MPDEKETWVRKNLGVDVSHARELRKSGVQIGGQRAKARLAPEGPREAPPLPTQPPPPVPSRDGRPALTGETEYKLARKKLEPLERVVNRIKDKPESLKLLRDKYLATAGLVEVQLKANKFPEASDLLPDLERDLNAAVQARRSAIEADTKSKVDEIKNGLDETDVGGKKVKERVGGTKWCKVVDKITAVQLDEDFDARYDEICSQVASALADDKDVQKAFKNWNKWKKDPVTYAGEITKSLEAVLKVQSNILGIDPPTPVFTMSDPSDPDDCGGYAAGRGSIRVNTAANDFSSFKELLDTLTHENTHAYQTKLIDQFRAGTIKPGDQDYAAAMALEMNDGDGYIDPDNEELYQKKMKSKAEPYNDQCCEVHAWGAGKKAGKAAYKLLKTK